MNRFNEHRIEASFSLRNLFSIYWILKFFFFFVLDKISNSSLSLFYSFHSQLIQQWIFYHSHSCLLHFILFFAYLTPLICLIKIKLRTRQIISIIISFDAIHSTPLTHSHQHTSMNWRWKMFVVRVENLTMRK